MIRNSARAAYWRLRWCLIFDRYNFKTLANNVKLAAIGSKLRFKYL